MGEKFGLEKHRDYIVKRTVSICFLFLLLIHILDILSTLIALNLGATESNPIIVYFLTFGFFGWIISSMFVITVFLISFFIISFLPKIYEKTICKQIPLEIECTLYLVFALILFSRLLLAVINNVVVIFRILI